MGVILVLLAVLAVVIAVLMWGFKHQKTVATDVAKVDSAVATAKSDANAVADKVKSSL